MAAWLPLGLVIAVAVLGVSAIVGTIKAEARLTRTSSSAHAAAVQEKLQEIHRLTNSSLTSVQAALVQANQKIETLEAALVQMAAEKRAEAQR